MQSFPPPLLHLLQSWFDVCAASLQEKMVLYVCRCRAVKLVSVGLAHSSGFGHSDPSGMIGYFVLGRGMLMKMMMGWVVV